MEAVVIKDFDELETYKIHWEDLAAHAAEPNIFYEPWMLLPALKYLPETGRWRKPLQILLLFEKSPPLSSEDNLVGFFPFEARRYHYERIPIEFLRFWRYKFCYLCTPLIRKGSERKCIEAFFSWLKQVNSKHELILWNQIDDKGPLLTNLKCYLADNQDNSLFFKNYFYFERAFLMKQEDPGTHLISMMSAKHHKDLRRREKDLKEKGQLTCHFTEPKDPVDRWVDEFLKLEASGWKGRKGIASNITEGGRLFLLSVLTEGQKKGRLFTTTLRFNGRLVAANINFFAGDGGFSFMTAYDDSFSKYSPGVLLEHKFINQFYDLRNLQWLDSCASADNSMIHRIWRDRRRIAFVPIATRLFPEGLILKAFPFKHLRNKYFSYATVSELFPKQVKRRVVPLLAFPRKKVR